MLSSHADPAVTEAEMDGLARAVTLGAVAGFLLVFGLSAACLLLVTTYGLVPSLAASAFIGAFGGIGFGAMLGGAIHH